MFVHSLSWKFVEEIILFPNPQVAVLILNRSVLKEDNEDTISKIQAQVDIMSLIKSFNANNLKDGTFTSGESSARKYWCTIAVEYLTVKLGECRTL